MSNPLKTSYDDIDTEDTDMVSNRPQPDEREIYGYKILGTISIGAFGIVWDAFSPKGQPVVIKKLRGDFITNRNETSLNIKEQFSFEENGLKAVRDFCSTTTVCYIDSFVKNNNYYIVMDKIFGFPLSQLVADPRDNPYDIKYYDLIEKLISGLKLLHEAGVTNQDIKLENIMWDNVKAIPLYIDWGLACLKRYCRNECTKPCGSLADKYYYPQELDRIKGKPIDFTQAICHDVWSLGVTLLHWFAKDSTIASLHNLHKITDQYKVNSLIDRYLDDFVKKSRKHIFDYEQEYVVWSDEEIIRIDLILKRLLLVDPDARLNSWIQLSVER